QRHAAVAAADRLAPAGSLGGKIGGGEQSAALVRKARHLDGRVAFIKRGAASSRQRRKGARQVRVDDLRTGARRSAVAEENRRRLRLLHEFGYGLFDPAREARRDRETVARI